MAKHEVAFLEEIDLKFLGACTVELGLGGIAIVLGLSLGPNPRDRIPLWSRVDEISIGLGIGVLGGIVLAVAMLLVQRLPWRFIQALNETATEQMVQMLRPFSIPQLIALSMCAGVGEELLFRGWLMQSIAGDMTSSSLFQIFLGLAISSIVFGLVHPLSKFYVIYASLMGGFLGLLYWQTNNLIAPITAHWIYDAIVMVWLVKSKAESV